MPHDAALGEYIAIFRDAVELSPIFYLGYKSQYIQVLEKLCFCFYENNGTNGEKYSGLSRSLKSIFDNSYIGCILQASILKRYLTNKLKKN